MPALALADPAPRRRRPHAFGALPSLPATVVPLARPPRTSRAEPLRRPPVRLAPHDPLGRKQDGNPAQAWSTPHAMIPSVNPKTWSFAMARTLVEVVDGTRNPHDIARWLAPSLFDALRERHRLARRCATPQRGAHVRTRSVSLSLAKRTPTYLAIEVTAVVDVDGFSRPLAMRIESYRGRWKITAVEIG